MVMSANVPTSRTSRASCDRCYLIKERCTWAEIGSDACSRCTRLGHTCTTQRAIRQAGRKPRRNGNGLRAWKGARPLCSKDPPQNDRAEDLETIASNSHQHGSHIHHDVALLPQLLPRRKSTIDGALTRVMDMILNHDSFLTQWIIGPSFLSSQKHLIATRLASYAPLLKDAILAMSIYDCDAGGQVVARHGGPSQQFALRRASRSVELLRTMTVVDAQALSVFLVLGMLITTVAAHLSASRTRTICQFVLQQVELLQNSRAVSFSDADGFSCLVCLVYSEIEECLLAGHIPTIRYDGLGLQTCTADRYLGVSLSMLPYLYDICKLNQAWRSSSNDADRNELRGIATRLEQRIRHWTAAPALLKNGRLTPIEVVHMSAQAAIVQSGALLILHRIQHRYDDSDHVSHGLRLARDILDQLHDAKLSIGRTVLCSEIAFLAACLEFEDLEDMTLKSGCERRYSRLEIAKGYDERLVSCMTLAWAAKKVNPGIHWSDLPDALTALHIR